MDNQIDLGIALRKLHELAVAEGDLGREYWYQVGQLLKQAAGMQSELDSISRELEICRAKRQRSSVVKGDRVTALMGVVRKPTSLVHIDCMNAPSLSLDEELLARAQALTGVTDNTILVQQALLALIERNSAKAPSDGSEPPL